MIQHGPSGTAKPKRRRSAAGSLPGFCIFVDGPAHDQHQQTERDRELREDLRDHGYRVIAIRYDRGFDEQISPIRDVFGESTRSTDSDHAVSVGSSADRWRLVTLWPERATGRR